MIRHLQVLHYRAFKYIDVNLSNFHILIGPNASGKSTFLDAINLIKDILDDSPRMAVEKRASRFDELLWRQQGDKFEIAIELEIPENVRKMLKREDFSFARYEVSLQLDIVKGCTIGGENLWLMREGTVNSSRSVQRTLFLQNQKNLSISFILARKPLLDGGR